MIDEKKIIANVTNVSTKPLTFYVLAPLINGQRFRGYDLNNATKIVLHGQDVEYSSEQFRNRAEKKPYVNDLFPSGYLNGVENFYPMRLRPSETKNGLPMVKEYLDALVTRGLITYTQTNVMNTSKVKAVAKEVVAHGETIPKGKTRDVELTNEILKLVSDELLIGQLTVTNISPNTGSHLGGTNVTITGNNFNSLMTVKFGTNTATFTVDSVTQITATTPAHAVGAVNVVLQNDLNTVTVTNGFTYS